MSYPDTALRSTNRPDIYYGLLCTLPDHESLDIACLEKTNDCSQVIGWSLKNITVVKFDWSKLKNIGQ